MKAEHKYRALIHQSPDPIFVSRIDDFAFTDVNERACANYGYTRKELLNMEIFDIETKAPLRQQVRDLYEATEIGHVVEVNGVDRRKDGTVFPVHVRFSRLDDEYAIASSRDMTVPEAVLKSGVYVVTKALLGVQPGDQVTVRDSHSALHRYLGYLDLKAMLQSGALEWVRDITPTSSVPRRRGQDSRPPDLHLL